MDAVPRSGRLLPGAVGWWVCVLLGTVVLLAARASSAASVVPWVDKRPARPAAQPPLAAPCRARSVRVRLFLQGATGSLVGGFSLTNVGASACSLLGWPRVAFTGGSAVSARWRVKRMARQSVSLDVLADPPGSLRALAPGKAASVVLFWSNWCAAGNPGGGNLPAPPTGLRVGFASVTSMLVPLAQAPRCDQPQNPSTLSVAPFAPAVRMLPPSSRLRLEVAILGHRSVAVKPGLRAFRVHRGTVFAYQVAVTNTAATPFRFSHATCPVYVQQLLLGAAKPYLLNCRSVGVIAARGAVVFAMRIRVPPTARLGVGSLTWQLAPRTYIAPFATAAVWVVP